MIRVQNWVAYVVVSVLLTVTSQSVVLGQEAVNIGRAPITPENADQVMLLSTLWYPGAAFWKFSPDGSMLIAYNREQTLQIWDMFSLTLRGALNKSNIEPQKAIFSPDSTKLALVFSSSIELYNLQSLEKIDDLRHGGSPELTGIHFSPDSLLLATSNADQTVRVWDTTTGEQRFSLEQGVNFAGDTAFNFDNKLLATSDSERVFIWDTNSGKQIASLDAPNSSFANLLFSRNGSALAVINTVGGENYANRVRLWDTITWTKQFDLKADAINISADLNWAVVNRGDNAQIINLSTGERIGDFQRGEGCGSENLSPIFAFSPDGNTVAVCYDDGIKLFDTLTGLSSTSIPVTFPWQIVYSSDSSLLFLQNYSGGETPFWNVQIYNTRNGKNYIKLPLFDAWFTVSPDVSTLLSGTSSFGGQAFLGQVMMLYGIPTPERPAFASVPGHILPSAINVRDIPSMDAKVTGKISGEVVIDGVDPSKQFFHLASHDGWVRSDPSYVDLGIFSTIDQLKILQ